MNAFDFDGTLYSGDSTLDFWIYALRRHPRCFSTLPNQLAAALEFKIGLIEREAFKERFYSFLSRINDIDELIADFWKSAMTKLNTNVVARTNPGDLVVSASPRFLLETPCSLLDMNLIASDVNEHTGTLEGPNCRGMQKVEMVREAGYRLPFDEFYTDSKSDMYLAKCSQKAFLVTKKGIEPYPSNWLY